MAPRALQKIERASGHFTKWYQLALSPSWPSFSSLARVPQEDLHFATERGHQECVRLLVAGGAEPDAPDAEGTTPLLMVAWRGKVELAVMLVELGANVSGTGRNLARPLHWAVRRGHMGLLEYLVDVGADPSAKDASGRKPRDWATPPMLAYLDGVGSGTGGGAVNHDVRVG